MDSQTRPRAPRELRAEQRQYKKALGLVPWAAGTPDAARDRKSPLGAIEANAQASDS